MRGPIHGCQLSDFFFLIGSVYSLVVMEYLLWERYRRPLCHRPDILVRHGEHCRSVCCRHNLPGLAVIQQCPLLFSLRVCNFVIEFPAAKSIPVSGRFTQFELLPENGLLRFIRGLVLPLYLQLVLVSCVIAPELRTLTGKITAGAVGGIGLVEPESRLTERIRVHGQCLIGPGIHREHLHH